MHTNTLTPDREKAAQAVADLIHKAQDLKQRWLDAPLWATLYRQYGLKRPPNYLPCTPKYMRRYLSKIGISPSQCCDYLGFKTLKTYQEANPKVPLWAFLGTILEAKHGGFLAT